MPEAAAFLKALTPDSKVSLGSVLFEITKFPFRVGRECRLNPSTGVINDRRRPDSIPNNDLYLIEIRPPLNVSREHFQIEKRDGLFYLVDRGSVCGTLVECVAIGGDRSGGEKQLENGDVIIVGTSESRHIFKFLVNP